MSSFDSSNKVNKSGEESKDSSKKLEVSTLRYFWDIGIFSNKKTESIPRFLSSMELLRHFSSNERRIFGKSLHVRHFKSNEKVFNKGDIGFGFYFIFRGGVNVFYDDELSKPVTNLEKGDYFGEISLLQESCLRNATVIANSDTILLGLLKPDLDDLVETHPGIAAKVLQSLSSIVAGRVFSLAEEIRLLKQKLDLSERSNND